jgi:DNA polymerase-3 subunit epsilon
MAGVKWTQIPVHVIDFEGSARTGVVEYGIVTVQNGDVVAANSRLCRGKGKLNPEESRIHGLTDDDLIEAEPFDVEWPQFASLRESGVLAAHFSATENRLLRAVWPCPRMSPDFLQPGKEIAEWGPWIDTGRLANELLPKTHSAGLEAVVDGLQLGADLKEKAAQFCPEGRSHFHCAPFDALACALVLLRLANDSDGIPCSLSRLLAMSTADRDKREERSQGQLF